MGVSVEGVDGSRYARYVGRVGALAVALGVGAAVATGQGMGIGIARADESAAGAAEGSASVGSSADPSSPDTGDQAAAPTPPAGSDHPDSADTDDDAGASGMNVSSSGGADTSVNDKGQSTDTQSDSDDDEPEGGDDGADAGGDDATTEPDATPAPGPQAGAGSNSGAQKTNSPAPPDVTPNLIRAEVKSDTDVDAASATTTSQTSVPVQSRLAATGGSANLTAFATNADESAPSTTTQQQSLLSVPNTAVGLASTFVAALLSPFLAPGPTAPAEPPLLWALLGWVRREVQRTFFNKTPVAVADPVTTSEDTPKVIDVLANDTDDFEQDSLTVTKVTQPANGTVVINPDGTLTYTPKANFAGTDTFSYTVSDAESSFHLHGLLSIFAGQKHTATGTVTVTVTGVNDAPVADNDAYTVDEDTVLLVSAADGVLNGDTDVDNTAAQLKAVLGSGPTNGTLNLNDDGSFSYSPDDNFHGTDTFAYRTTDGTTTTSNLATVTITVKSVNDAPTAGFADYTIDEDTVFHGTLNAVDVDGDALVYGLGLYMGQGNLVINPDGSFTYAPAPNYAGFDAFGWQVTDPQGQIARGVVRFTINPVDDAPVADDDTATVADGGTTTIDVVANDTDPDGNATIDPTTVQITQPAHGSASVNADGTITYESNGEEVTTDSFTYTVNDSSGAISNTATVTVTVTPVNDAPVAVTDAYSTNEDTPLTVSGPGVLDNDTDVDSFGLTAVLVSQPTKGTLTLNSDGSFTYTPNENVNGTDLFTYKVNDGTSDSNTTTVNITINPVDDKPTAPDASYTIDENNTLTVVLGGGDADGDPVIRTISTLPAHGTLTREGDTVTYTPNTNYFGTDQFRYVVRNADGSNPVIGTVNITINPVND